MAVEYSNEANIARYKAAHTEQELQALYSSYSAYSPDAAILAQMQTEGTLIYPPMAESLPSPGATKADVEAVERKRQGETENIMKGSTETPQIQIQKDAQYSAALAKELGITSWTVAGGMTPEKMAILNKIGTDRILSGQQALPQGMSMAQVQRINTDSERQISQISQYRKEEAIAQLQKQYNLKKNLTDAEITALRERAARSDAGWGGQGKDAPLSGKALTEVQLAPYSATRKTERMIEDIQAGKSLYKVGMDLNLYYSQLGQDVVSSGIAIPSPSSVMSVRGDMSKMNVSDITANAEATVLQGSQKPIFASDVVEVTETAAGSVAVKTPTGTPFTFETKYSKNFILADTGVTLPEEINVVGKDASGNVVYTLNVLPFEGTYKENKSPEYSQYEGTSYWQSPEGKAQISSKVAEFKEQGFTDVTQSYFYNPDTGQTEVEYSGTKTIPASAPVDFTEYPKGSPQQKSYERLINYNVALENTFGGAEQEWAKYADIGRNVAEGMFFPMSIPAKLAGQGDIPVFSDIGKSVTRVTNAPGMVKGLLSQGGQIVTYADIVRQESDFSIGNIEAFPIVNVKYSPSQATLARRQSGKEAFWEAATTPQTYLDAAIGAAVFHVAGSPAVKKVTSEAAAEGARFVSKGARGATEAVLGRMGATESVIIETARQNPTQFNANRIDIFNKVTPFAKDAQGTYVMADTVGAARFTPQTEITVFGKKITLKGKTVENVQEGTLSGKALNKPETFAGSSLEDIGIGADFPVKQSVGGISGTMESSAYQPISYTPETMPFSPTQGGYGGRMPAASLPNKPLSAKAPQVSGNIPQGGSPAGIDYAVFDFLNTKESLLQAPKVRARVKYPSSYSEISTDVSPTYFGTRRPTAPGSILDVEPSLPASTKSLVRTEYPRSAQGTPLLEGAPPKAIMQDVRGLIYSYDTGVVSPFSITTEVLARGKLPQGMGEFEYFQLNAGEHPIIFQGGKLGYLKIKEPLKGLTVSPETSAGGALDIFPSRASLQGKAPPKSLPPAKPAKLSAQSAADITIPGFNAVSIKGYEPTVLTQAAKGRGAATIMQQASMAQAQGSVYATAGLQAGAVFEGLMGQAATGAKAVATGRAQQYQVQQPTTISDSIFDVQLGKMGAASKFSNAGATRQIPKISPIMEFATKPTQIPKAPQVQVPKGIETQIPKAPQIQIPKTEPIGIFKTPQILIEKQATPQIPKQPQISKQTQIEKPPQPPPPIIFKTDIGKPPPPPPTGGGGGFAFPFFSGTRGYYQKGSLAKRGYVPDLFASFTNFVVRGKAPKFVTGATVQPFYIPATGKGRTPRSYKLSKNKMPSFTFPVVRMPRLRGIRTRRRR